MPPATPNDIDEDAFMNSLLSGLDSQMSSAGPSTTKTAKTPVKRRPSPVKKRSPLGQKATLQPELDLATLVQGAENWDWDDMEAEFLTPRKNATRTPKRACRRSSPSKRPSRNTATSVPADSLNVAELLDGAENWDWEDMEADFLTPKKDSSKAAKPFILPAPEYAQDTCTRCIVETVKQDESASVFEKVLRVKLEPDGEHRTVILRDDWANTDVRPGDTINVLGNFDSTDRSITISSKRNTLILHPDLLITATAISNAPQCRRKPLLTTLVRSTSDITPSLVWGSMLHEVMQACMVAQRWDERWIDERIDEVVRNGLAELVKIGLGVDEAKREVKARSKGLRVFSERYIADIPKSDAVLTNTRAAYNQTSLLAVSKLHEIEEDIWSPTYGLKGKLDASVQAVIVENTNNQVGKGIQGMLKSHTMPFEIKTGRAVAGMEHRAQTMLYTLLAAERYGVDVPSGLLYYTQSEEVVRVPQSRNELRGLLGARNDMASYTMRRNNPHRKGKPDDQWAPSTEPFLPPTIDDEWICKKCYAVDTCMLYRKAVENVIDVDSPIADIYELKTSHLTPSQSAFFKKWEALISLEEHDIVRFRKELWTLHAQEREERGRCFGSMVIDLSYVPTPVPQAPQKGGNIHRCTYRFVRESRTRAGNTNLLEGHMNSGDAITISVEPDLLALARGFILELTPHEIVVGVDHELDVNKLKERLSFKRVPHGQNVIFRIDKDEMSGGLGRLRDNLAQLFYADGDSRRLSLVVDLQRPVFDEEEKTLELLRSVPEFKSATSILNESQIATMTKVLSARDYALVLGMPGTGKTTVIAALLQTLVGMGKTVLVVSYTHSAVDTILLKVKDDDFGILRLGNVDKVHPDVRKFTLAGRKIPTTIEQLEHQIMTPPVVATTCLSIDHALFSRRTFDYCIVDEASQITLPTCIGPLRFADKFVLVGDHFQLPPLVRNVTARKNGLDTSLFRLLSNAHPHSVADLTHQYRMNADIMLLSNTLIYSGRLKCGSEEVARQTLKLPDSNFLKSLSGGTGCICPVGKCWIGKVLEESCNIIFIDTDLIPARDDVVGSLIQNPVEAYLVTQLVEALLLSGVPVGEIGVISLYRQQLKLLVSMLEGRGGKDVEVITVDRSQGRDKDCVIVSMVRSNENGQIGELIKDWRRLNVAFTRARKKLVVIGSRRTLGGVPVMKEFFELMDKKSWILSLPRSVEEWHPALGDKTKAVLGNLNSGCKKDGCSSGKRQVVSVEKENGQDGSDGCLDEYSSIERPIKRARLPRLDEGLMRGRPLLRDVVNGESAV